MEAAVIEGTVEGQEVELVEDSHERRELCFGLETVIKGAIAEGRAAMWELARALYAFNEESGWVALGYESQGEWLAQPEIGMSKRQYHRLVRLYRETVIMREIDETTMAELEPSKVEIVLPSIEANVTTVAEALEDAGTLGVRDLREKYIGPQGAPKGPKGVADASGATLDGSGPSEDPQDAWLKAALTFDSWVEMGGDKRKALRNWQRFLDAHPVVQAINLIQAFADGKEYEGEVPSKESLQDAWAAVSKGLRLKLS